MPCAWAAVELPCTPLPLTSIANVNAILIGPERAERIIVCNNRDVWRSEDGGVTWENFAGVLSERIIPPNRGGVSNYLSADSSGSILCIGADKNWAISRDGGRQWHDISLADLDLVPDLNRPLHIVVDGHGKLYATGQLAAQGKAKYAVRTRNYDGDDWTTLRTGMNDEDFTLFRAGSHLGILARRKSKGLACSIDGGQTWADWPTQDGFEPNANYYRRGQRRQFLLMAHPSDGASWLSGTMLEAIRIADDGSLAGRFLHFPPGWGSANNRLGTPMPHPDHSNEIFAEYLGHLARSSDGGRTWGIDLRTAEPLAENGLHGWIRRKKSWFLLASTPHALVALEVTNTLAPTDVSLPTITILNGSMPDGPTTAVRTCFPLWMCKQAEGPTLIGDGVHLWRQSEAKTEAQLLDLPLWPAASLLRYPALMPQIAEKTWHIEAWSDRSPGLLSADGGRTFTSMTPPGPPQVPGWWRAGIFNRTNIACIFLPYSWNSHYSTHLSSNAGKSWKPYQNPRLGSGSSDPTPTLYTKANSTVLVQRFGEAAFTTQDGRMWRNTGTAEDFSNTSPTPRLPDGAYVDTDSDNGRRILPRDSDTVIIDPIYDSPDQAHWLIPDFPQSTAISQRGWTVVATTDSGKTWLERDPTVTSVLPCRVMRNEQGVPQLVTIDPDGVINSTVITADFIASFQIAVR